MASADAKGSGAMSNVIQLDAPKPAPRYAIGQTFTLRRNAWSRELITATVETARWTESFGFIYTVAISGKYRHWRVIFEYQLVRQIVETVKAA